MSVKEKIMEGGTSNSDTQSNVDSGVTGQSSTSESETPNSKRQKTGDVNSPVSQSNSPITKSLDKLGKAYDKLVPRVQDAKFLYKIKKNSKPLKRARMILDLTMDSLRNTK